MRFASLFSGFGLADIGAMQAGYEPVYACEIDPKIADVYRRNIGDHVQVCDVRDAEVPGDIDLLHASPVCKSFSIANTSGAEHADDIATAQATADIIRRVRPRAVTIENVRAYAKSESLRRITSALDELGYWWVADILNAADYGVPQNRVRLIVRARRDGAMIAPIARSHERLSWDGAISDLIDDLPDTELAKWLRERLPDLFGSNQSEYGDPVRASGAPALSVTGQHAGRQRILVDGRNGRVDTGGPTIVPAGLPSMTQCAGARMAHRIIDGYTVKAVTPRCMARWQTLPDGYDLPPTKSLAATGIGNGVPCELYRLVAESVAPNRVTHDKGQ